MFVRLLENNEWILLNTDKITKVYEFTDYERRPYCMIYFSDGSGTRVSKSSAELYKLFNKETQ